MEVVKPADSLGGEDFAFYQEKIKGMFILVGTGRILSFTPSRVSSRSNSSSCYFELASKNWERIFRETLFEKGE